MTVTEYLRRKDKLRYSTYVMKDGHGYYIEDGKCIPEKEFERANELPISFYEHNKINSDKTRDWMRVE